MGADPRPVALTGGSGFLGSHIADALGESGRAVRVAVRPTSDRRWLAGKDLEIVEVDLLDVASCRAFLAGTGAVIHCAGVVSAPDEAAYRRGNVETTEALLEAAAGTWSAADAATFLLVSSLAAHGPAPLDAPAREDQPCRPLTAYGRTKRAAEKALEDAPGDFRRVVLRPPSLYGPRDEEFVPLLKAATHGFTARLGRSMTGLSLVHGRDAAEAAVALLDTPSATGPYFVGDDRGGYDWDALRDALAEAAGRRLHRWDVPLELLRFAQPLAGLCGEKASLVLNRDRIRDLDTPGWVCDDARLKQDTGFTARRPAAAGFAETIAFWNERGWP